MGFYEGRSPTTLETIVGWRCLKVDNQKHKQPTTFLLPWPWVARILCAY